MKKTLLLLTILISSFSFSQVQNVTFSISPSVFNENQQITITVADLNPQTAWGVSDIYLWAWSLDLNNLNSLDSPTNGSWTNSNEAQKFTNNNNGTYSFSFTPTTLYNRTNIGSIGFLVKAKDATGDKKSQDKIVKVGAFQLTLTAPTNNITILNPGQSLAISATASLPSDFVLKANGTIINTSTSATSYSFNHTNITQNTNYILEATNNAETKSVFFQAIVSIVEQAVPAGMKDGINLNEADATKATLVLYAPQKNVVYLIGDFNNWQADNTYLLKKDTANNRFWIELTGLTPQTNHMYQYLVDGNIKIADPYSTTILDESNDSYINATTYPNLPAYPTGKTNHAVTVLRTGDTPYNWQTPNFQQPEKTDLVIYELLIRDFDNLHSFDAVKSRLDYLQNLGINAIELMPVSEFDGNESWGYNPSFHMALDKYYGTPKAFKQFIDECHSRGIAVILDVVYNHATGQNPFYRLWNTDNGGYGGQAAADSPFFNPTATHTYSVFNDFNHSKQATKDYVKRTTQYWIDEYKIDGFRWDLTKGFTQNCTSSDEACTGAFQADRVAVLKEYADYQWQSNPDFYVIFEHLGTDTEEKEWANYRINENKGIMLWGNMNSNYNENTMGWVDNNSSDGVKTDISRISYKERGFSKPNLVGYMESHDEERLMYKNLQYGNSNTTYNVKNLNTALSRQELAGMFFFTIPGPKMIWQFGELGYDFSINTCEDGTVSNDCRLAKKPIRWDYFDNANRKQIYNTWATLAAFKKNQPVFNTTDFTLNVGTLTKSILLKHATMDVALAGNFDITSKTIAVQFSKTGTWYEYFTGEEKTITNTSTEITLNPGEYKLYSTVKLLDPRGGTALDDSDGDCVADTADLCPNTPMGTNVNSTGCPIFSLPANNFTVEVISETCPGKNNGQIKITALTALNYTLTINNVAYNFTTATTYISANLAPGTYNFCIEVVGQTYSQCYVVQVAAGTTVSGKSIITSGKASVEIKKGTAPYIVYVNGQEQFETSAPIFSVDVKSGDILEVKTAVSCEGIYSKTIDAIDGVFAYPNPTNSAFEITVPTTQTEVVIEIYSILSQLISVKTYPVVYGKVQLSLENKPTGLYFAKVNLDEPVTIKIIKQ
ncbi:MAG: alpha-amylase family glycosyl hydrolase [Lutibacter sp.]